jgi:hypothetical protein
MIDELAEKRDACADVSIGLLVGRAEHRANQFAILDGDRP